MSAELLPDALRALDPATHYREVERILREAGWTPCGQGDWAFALASPDGVAAARISPFDPVGPFTAQLYAEAAGTGAVPRLDLHRRLAGGADLLVMEFLHPVDEHEAKDFLERVRRGDGELAELSQVVHRVHATARAELPWCGPLDSNPSNVMRGADGRLVLIDPFYADGPALYGMAQEDPDRFVTTLPPEQRRHLTEIPLGCSGPWPEAEREALRARLQRADRERPAEDLIAASTGSPAAPPRSVPSGATRVCSRAPWPARRWRSTSTPAAGRCSAGARAWPASSTSPSPGRRTRSA